MQRSVTAIAVCIAALAAGCAADIDMAKVEREKIYRTGSNIAERDHGMASNVESKTVNTADPQLGLPSAGRLPRSFGGGN
jgi:hypothetical protein